MIPQSPNPGPPPDPERPVTEADRDVIVQQLQHALADGRIEFEELDDRFALVYAATNRGELDRATDDLPMPPPPPAPAYHPAPPSTFSLLGDVKIGGWLGGTGPIAATTIVGDVVIDVTTMAVDDGIRVSARSGLGDITVIVPDGVFVRVSATTLIGDRKEKLVPPLHGAPAVEIDALSFLGVTDLADGWTPWAAVGFMAVLVGALFVHNRRREYRPMFVVTGLLALSLFVAWGRFVYEQVL